MTTTDNAGENWVEDEVGEDGAVEEKAESYRGWPLWRLKRDAKLSSYKAVLDKKFGAGAWGNDELVDLLDDYKRKREAKARGEKAADTKSKNKVQGRFDDIVAGYMRKFEDVTPADEEQFRQLAGYQIQREVIAQKLDDLLSNTEADAIEIEKMVNSLNKVTSAYNHILALAGLDRKSRDANVDTHDEITRMVKGADELLKEHAVQIRCPSCKKNGIDINYGYILFHFRKDVDWSFTAVCPHPKCGCAFEIGSKKKENTP